MHRSHSPVSQVLREIEQAEKDCEEMLDHEDMQWVMDSLGGEWSEMGRQVYLLCEPIPVKGLWLTPHEVRKNRLKKFKGRVWEKQRWQNCWDYVHDEGPKMIKLYQEAIISRREYHDSLKEKLQTVRKEMNDLRNDTRVYENMKITVKDAFDKMEKLYDEEQFILERLSIPEESYIYNSTGLDHHKEKMAYCHKRL